MVPAVRASRGIEEVPSVIVGALSATGDLPRLAAEIEALGRRGTLRDPLPVEVANVRWLIAHEREKPVGVAAFRDVYDPHTSATVREVVHIAGSRRAVVALGRLIIDEAAIVGLPVIASVDVANRAMQHLLSRLGLVAERVTFAIGGER